MARRAPHGRRSWGRRLFRGGRFCALSLLLLVLSGLIYFNQVGLPGFLERRLVAELRARGVELEFSRLRLRWYRGLVAETVTLTQPNLTEGPELTFGEVVLDLDAAALAHLRLQLNALELLGGRLVVPLASTNEPAQRLVVDHISTHLRFQPGDRWELDRFQAECFGAAVSLSGTLSNASAMSEWSAGRTGSPAAGLWQEQIRRASRFMKNLRFRQPPEIYLDVHGDARDLSAWVANVRCSTAAADTSWGTTERLQLRARLNQPSGTNGLGLSEVQLEVNDLRTPWSEAGRALLDVRYLQSFTNAFPASADWDLRLEDIYTPWGETAGIHVTAHGAQCPDNPRLLRTDITLTSDALRSAPGQSSTNRLTAQGLHDWENPIPLQADWQLRVAEPVFALGTARELRLAGHLSRAPRDAAPPADESWAWWAWLQPVELDWEGEIDQLSVSNVVVDHLATTGHWRAPDVSVSSLHADLYGRHFDLAAQVNVQTRAARADCRLDFDVYHLLPWMNPAIRRWLSQYTWQEPPRVEGSVSAILPPWTQPDPNWQVELLPTLRLEGHLQARNAFYRTVPLTTAETHFRYANGAWHVPDFQGARPEGRIQFEHWADTRSEDYFFRFRAQVDPAALKPLLAGDQRKAFDLFQFNEAPVVEGEFHGRYHAPERTRLDAHVMATNFVFREEPVSRLDARVLFTNAHLTATAVALDSGSEWVRADGVGFDLDSQRLYLTNATARMDPFRVARAIGPKTARTLSPYVFRAPPTACVNGWVNVSDTDEVDMNFEISGGPFNYWRFNVPQISTVVYWANRGITLSNVVSRFYGGRMSGDFHFDLTSRQEADFRFQTQYDDVDFHALMADLQSPTNRLEGVLKGAWTVTRANTGDWQSWQGLGRANLRDGFLWDMPLFGIFSPVLDAIVPGVGNSRVSGLTATFTLTNSLIRTDDLELRSPAMRLAYRGTFDFNGNVDARVEARVLRDLWGIGPLLSLALSPLTKMFEYRVTGTLSQPRKEPLFIPKPLLFPLRPLQTLKEMFGEDKPPTSPRPEVPAPSEGKPVNP
jgi:hypothetical protein